MSDEVKKPEEAKTAETKPAEVKASEPKAVAPQPVVEDFKEFILVVEDSLPNRNILVHLLKKLGFNVKEAADGEIAWTLLEESAASGSTVEAIISDIMMPKMNGVELLEKVRKSTKYAQTKFVLVTAVSDKDYIMQAKQWDVNGYLLKPISYDKISAKMNQLFPGRKLNKIAS